MSTNPPSGASERREPAPATDRFDPAEVLSRLWQQNLPVMRERVNGLDRAAHEAMAGRLSPSARTAASDLAHKLAGSLGMFGYPRGTEIAREIEHLLEAPEPPDPLLLVQLANDLRSILPL